MTAVYLAGPDVFLPDAVHVGRRKVEACRARALEGLFPLELDGDRHGEDAEAIFARNRRAMDRADAALVNLTPFRGPSADVGTVFELGYLSARRVPLFGYSAAVDDYAARVAALWGPVADGDDSTCRVADLLGPTTDVAGAFRDRDGNVVEAFSLADNLMIVRAIAASGGRLVVAAEPAGSRAPLAAFAAFDLCLEALLEYLAALDASP